MPQRLLTCALLAVAPLAAIAQPARGVALTREASHYRDLEVQLADALATRESANIDARVPGSFQYRGPETADAIDRATWLKRESGMGSRISNIAVRQEGDASIVSFLATSKRFNRFVVDVWRGDQLVARYAARLPGAPRPAERPSGRE